MNTSKLSVRECFRFGGVMAPMLLVFKVLRVNLAGQEVCACDIHDLIMIEDGQLESRCEEAPGVNDLRRDVLESGGEFLFGYTLPPHHTKMFSLVYLVSNRCLVEIIHTNAEETYTMVVALTPMEPHNEKVTVLFPPKKGMDPDPLDDGKKLASGTVRELLELHQARPSKSPLKSLPETHEQVLSYIVGRNQRAIQRFVRRGLYAPLPPDDEY